MNRNKLYLIVLAVIVAAVVLIVTPAILPANDTDQPEPTTQDAPEPDEAQDEQTALEAAKIMTTWSPATDYNRTAAEDRASHLMTDERADQIIPPERAASGPEWNDAAQQEATSTPQVTLNHYTETEDHVISVRATWEWVTKDGKTLPGAPEERIYYFAFNEHGEIHDYTYETVRHNKSGN